MKFGLTMVLLHWPLHKTPGFLKATHKLAKDSPIVFRYTYVNITVHSLEICVAKCRLLLMTIILVNTDNVYIKPPFLVQQDSCTKRVRCDSEGRMKT